MQEVDRVETETPAGPTSQPVTPIASGPTVIPPDPASPTLAPTLTPTTAPTKGPTTEPTFFPPPELRLELGGPTDGDQVSSNAVVVHGVTTPGALVEINGIRTVVDRQGRKGIFRVYPKDAKVDLLPLVDP